MNLYRVIERDIAAYRKERERAQEKETGSIYAFLYLLLRVCKQTVFLHGLPRRR